MQLRLDLAESPAPAAVLWELARTWNYTLNITSGLILQFGSSLDMCDLASHVRRQQRGGGDALVARLLVSTNSSSAAESAAWATMEKPALVAEHFRFDRMVSCEPASSLTSACLNSAQTTSLWRAAAELRRNANAGLEPRGGRPRMCRNGPMQKCPARSVRLLRKALVVGVGHSCIDGTALGGGDGPLEEFVDEPLEDRLHQPVDTGNRQRSL